MTSPSPLTVAVVTPEGSAFEGTAESVVVPGHDGEVAFLRGHAPFVGAIGYGELRVRTPQGETRRWYLEGGVAQVLDDEVTVLADGILPAEKVDAAEAEKDLREALATTPTTDEAFGARDRRLASAHARLRIAQARQV
jgi:F-type H+-transporting ATPase subunit epsilon